MTKERQKITSGEVIDHDGNRIKLSDEVYAVRTLNDDGTASVVIYDAENLSLNDTIFNKELVKALFGNERVVSSCHNAPIDRPMLVNGKPYMGEFNRLLNKTGSGLAKGISTTFLPKCTVCEKRCGIVAHLGWKYHLSQMVLHDNPSKYIYDNLTDIKKEQ